MKYLIIKRQDNNNKKKQIPINNKYHKILELKNSNFRFKNMIHKNFL